MKNLFVVEVSLTNKLFCREAVSDCVKSKTAVGMYS